MLLVPDAQMYALRVGPTCPRAVASITRRHHRRRPEPAAGLDQVRTGTPASSRKASGVRRGSRSRRRRRGRRRAIDHLDDRPSGVTPTGPPAPLPEEVGYPGHPGAGEDAALDHHRADGRRLRPAAQPIARRLEPAAASSAAPRRSGRQLEMRPGGAARPSRAIEEVSTIDARLGLRRCPTSDERHLGRLERHLVMRAGRRLACARLAAKAVDGGARLDPRLLAQVKESTFASSGKRRALTAERAKLERPPGPAGRSGDRMHR